MCKKLFAGLVIALTFQITLETNAVAQGLYVRTGVGYAVPQAGQTMDGTATAYNGTQQNSIADSTTAYSISKMSFMQGVHVQLAGGYMFNEYVGIDLAGSFGVSMSQALYNDNDVNVNGSPSNVQIIQKAMSPLMLMPSLVLQYGGEKYKVYTRAGLVIPLKTKIQYDQILTNLPGLGAVESDDYSFTAKNSFSLGFTAALGASYKFTDQVDIFFEASLLSLSMYIKELDMTSVSVNGQGNYISQIPVAERNVYFSDKFTSATGDYNHQPVYSQPFSDLMFSIGFRFNFGNQTFTTKKGKPVKKYSDEDHINRF